MSSLLRITFKRHDALHFDDENRNLSAIHGTFGAKNLHDVATGLIGVVRSLPGVLLRVEAREDVPRRRCMVLRGALRWRRAVALRGRRAVALRGRRAVALRGRRAVALRGRRAVALRGRRAVALRGTLRWWNESALRS